MIALFNALRLAAALAFAGDVAALGSDDFDARQAATARLSAHADLAWASLPVRHPDLEVRRRVETIRAAALAGPWKPLPEVTGSYGSRTLKQRNGVWSVASYGPLHPSHGTRPIDHLCWRYQERAGVGRQNDCPAEAARLATSLLAADLADCGVPLPLLRRWLLER